MILTITLNLSIDRTLKIERLSRGKTNRVEIISSLPGGKGINVARCIKSLGGDVYVTGFKGGKIGEYIESSLLKEDITPILFEIEEDSRICNIVIEKDGTITEIYERGPKISQEEKHGFLNFLKGLKKRFSHVVISGSVPLGLDYEYYRKIVSLLKEKKVFIDFKGKFLVEALKEKPYFVKINEEEFKATFGKEPERALGKIAEEHGVEIFSVTLGEKGALACFNKKLFHVYSNFKLNVVNPVGAGDSFMGGFVYSNFLNKDIFFSLKTALACAMSNTTLFEGGKANLKILNEIFNSVIIEEV